MTSFYGWAQLFLEILDFKISLKYMEIASLKEVDCPKFIGQNSALINSHGKHQRITTTSELKRTTRNI